MRLFGGLYHSAADATQNLRSVSRSGGPTAPNEILCAAHSPGDVTTA